MKGSSSYKLRKMASLVPIWLLICGLFAAASTGLASTAETGNLAFEKNSVVWDVTSSQNLTLKINITDVTDLMGIVLSVHWDPTYLNLSAITPGDLLPTGMPEATGWVYTMKYAAGNLSEAANTFLPGNGPVSVSQPDWGWVMTLTFEFVGTAPPPGSPIETDIMIVDEPDADMDTVWTDNVPAIHDFDKLDDPRIHIVSTEIVPEFPLAVVMLALFMIVALVVVVFKKKRRGI